ncbi:MAG: hypothetical protein ACLFTK_13265 [Anaerolineales bacterium]
MTTPPPAERLASPEQVRRESLLFWLLVGGLVGLPLLFVLLMLLTPLEEPLQDLLGIAPPDDAGLEIYSVTCRARSNGITLYAIFWSADPAELQFESQFGTAGLGSAPPGLNSLDVAAVDVTCPTTITLLDTRNNRQSGAVVEILTDERF